MSQAGVSTAPARARRRQVIDFGVDESWEPAPPRRMRDVAPAPVAARSREPYGLSDSNDDFSPSWRVAEAAPASAGVRRRDDDLDWREDAYSPAGEHAYSPAGEEGAAT